MSNDTTRDGRRKHYDNTAEASFEFDARIGASMRTALKLVANNDYESKTKLTDALGHSGQRSGYKTVKRLLRRGFIDTDPHHPDANPNGHGAIVLTEKGRRYLAFLTPPDADNGDDR